MPKKNFKIIRKKQTPKGLAKPAGIKDKVINLLDLYTMIARKQYPSIGALRERFQISERSVHRYLEIIRMIDPIIYDREKGGYKFENGDRTKKMTLSKDDFLLLMTLGDAVTHMGSPLRANFQRFVDSFINADSSPEKGKEPRILVKLPDAIETEKLNEHFSAISECIKEKRRIEVRYNALHSGEITERRIDPYGLIFYEGTWLLIGYCHLRECVRHFALDKIAELKKTNLSFVPEEGFDLKGHLAHSWGIYDGKDVDVTVRFSAKVADYINRKDKWHPSEKRTVLPNGDIEMSFTVAGVNEIRRWIYAWIPNVEVIEPVWFRERMSREFEEAAKKHFWRIDGLWEFIERRR